MTSKFSAVSEFHLIFRSWGLIPRVIETPSEKKIILLTLARATPAEGAFLEKVLLSWCGDNTERTQGNRDHVSPLQIQMVCYQHLPECAGDEC